MGNNEILNELLDTLAKKYGDVDDDCGCYVRTERGYKWLSVKAVKDFLIETINA